MLGAAADRADIAIRGSIEVTAQAAAQLAPGDRLVIKLFHPRDGREMDPSYRIIDSFELPLRFAMAPAIDMRRQTKWSSYVVEAFTDRDGDVLSVVAGELHARTAGPLALGSQAVQLLLEPVAP